LPQLLIFPLLYTIVFFFLLYDYNRRLHAIVGTMREQFSATNATLNEALEGIEVVKATAQEGQEKLKFERYSRLYRDNFVRKGRIQAFYLPLLAFSIALVACFLHGFSLVTQSQLTLGGLIAFMGLAANLRNPVNLSLWLFELVQFGVVGAKRVLVILKEESDLDENMMGHSGQMHGDLAFEDVTFGYGTNPVLKHLSFTANRGQTIAIVGQTGSGKSTLAKLVNRIYETNSGRVLVDGRDVRDWNLDTLRSQISTIEQDIFLFSRSIAQNIAYGLGQRANRDAIEQAARLAQAHDFIMNFKDGYETEIGERGVTLSGGQRQRIAIARALLTDPRILILDDSTSAIDSATEDEIQEAIHRVLQNRTTLLITHRLSQIRRADKILVLSKGELIDQGCHEELLERCSIYRRIFSHSYESGQQDISSSEEESRAMPLSQPLTATGE
ncbi:MAG TPA: ABC transporter ATP-binding protein, partial [Ktedonobacteraceae bacterium]|nr:ABC transporter ATP-binding protein [Ktedonobacteraceae bacterium]